MGLDKVSCPIEERRDLIEMVILVILELEECDEVQQPEVMDLVITKEREVVSVDDEGEGKTGSAEALQEEVLLVAVDTVASGDINLR